MGGALFGAVVGPFFWLLLIVGPTALFMSSGGANLVSAPAQVAMMAGLCVGFPVTAIIGAVVGWVVDR